MVFPFAAPHELLQRQEHGRALCSTLCTGRCKIAITVTFDWLIATLLFITFCFLGWVSVKTQGWVFFFHLKKEIMLEEKSYSCRRPWIEREKILFFLKLFLCIKHSRSKVFSD